jgi:hypothetical protein
MPVPELSLAPDVFDEVILNHHFISSCSLTLIDLGGSCDSGIYFADAPSGSAASPWSLALGLPAEVMHTLTDGPIERGAPCD